MHSKLTKFLCLQLQFIPDLSRFLSTNCQQTELLKKSNAASISGSFRHVVRWNDSAKLLVFSARPSNSRPTHGLIVNASTPSGALHPSTDWIFLIGADWFPRKSEVHWDLRSKMTDALESAFYVAWCYFTYSSLYAVPVFVLYYDVLL